MTALKTQRIGCRVSSRLLSHATWFTAITEAVETDARPRFGWYSKTGSKQEEEAGGAVQLMEAGHAQVVNKPVSHSSVTMWEERGN
ncbi:hypothetical protein V492_05607 [Pseudogymnoascus sp. VKM F-4246]|nr:hypothetical protein V492_05607 [Pseudogymnoascus sp. VKM F-4246]